MSPPDFGCVFAFVLQTAFGINFETVLGSVSEKPLEFATATQNVFVSLSASAMQTESETKFASRMRTVSVN